MLRQQLTEQEQQNRNTTITATATATAREHKENVGLVVPNGGGRNHGNNISYGSVVVPCVTSSSNNHDNDDISIDDDDDDDEEEENDESLLSYDESEYEDDDDEDDEDDNDDEESNLIPKQNHLFSSCNKKHKKKKRHRHERHRHRRLRSNSTISDDDEDNGDDDEDDYDEEERWQILLKPVLSPIIKVYQVAKEAFILITHVDDVWDSPALRDDTSHISRSMSHASSSNAFRGRHPSAGIDISCGSVSFSSSSRQTNGPSAASGSWRDGFPNNNGYNCVSDESHIYGRDYNFGENNTMMMNTGIGQRVTFRHKLGVLFWFFILATAYASERGTFKIMVDRMGPFRMVVGVEVVLAIHAFILASWMCIRSFTCGRVSVKGTVMLPIVDIGVMAVLDSIQMTFAVISGSRVAPILTAVLIHFTIPVSTLMSTTFFPNQGQDGETTSRISPQHLFGSTLIFISSMFALSPAILTLIYPGLLPSQNVMANRTAWNTLLFTISCIPAALSQLYKEKTLSSFAQPVDSVLLNMLLSLFSCIFTFLISPLVFPLQGLADMPSSPGDGTEITIQSWIHQYPSTEVSINFSDALQCFTGNLDDQVQIRRYPEQAYCDFAYGLVLVYVFSTITINHAIDKICNAGAIKIMHRGISGGIILSVVLMCYYQIFVDDEEYGFLPNFYHISCAAILVMGSEVFHRVSLEKPSFETEYPPVVDLYDDQ